MKKICFLSTSLLTDRFLIYSDVLSALGQKCFVDIFSYTSENVNLWHSLKTKNCSVEKFPKVEPLKEFPFNYPLRRFNDLVWDFRLRSPSRLSAMRLRLRSQWRAWRIKALVPFARVAARFPVENKLESFVERCLLFTSRSHEAKNRLINSRPDVVISTRPHFFEDPVVVHEAKKLGIPVLAYITSWDNITTKHRLVYRYDGFLVWSDQMKEELHDVYPYSKSVPVYVVGAPQFDVFFQNRFLMTREDFCKSQNLDPGKPYILYALGSPNFISGEWYGAFYLAERIARGDLGDVQMIVRPHPLFDDGKLQDQFKDFFPKIVVQKTGQPGLTVNTRFQDETQVREWVNTFRHAGVVVNFASTSTIDASIVDRPVVNLDFDPEPGQPNQLLIREVNHEWSHFKPIAESGGVWQVNNMDELVMAVKTYLRQPCLHREKRRWIAEYVCGYVDGRCGNRLAEAIIDFVNMLAN